jgi:hypothetical protein
MHAYLSTSVCKQNRKFRIGWAIIVELTIFRYILENPD